MKSKNAVVAYVDRAPKDIRSKLRQVRAAIKAVAPGAIESISYRMPYYSIRENLSWNERSIVWFGLQRNHIGLYLPPPIISEHKKELKGYVITKSAVHLPLNKNIPVSLIKHLVKARLNVQTRFTKLLRRKAHHKQ